jgi:hypothetical protein
VPGVEMLKNLRFSTFQHPAPIKAAKALRNSATSGKKVFIAKKVYAKKESIREKGDWLLFRFLKKVPVPFFQINALWMQKLKGD